jgi:hypothetical protein
MDLASDGFTANRSAIRNPQLDIDCSSLPEADIAKDEKSRFFKRS